MSSGAHRVGPTGRHADTPAHQIPIQFSCEGLNMGLKQALELPERRRGLLQVAHGRVAGISTHIMSGRPIAAVIIDLLKSSNLAREFFV
jgi:hypothetical protein